MLHGLRVICCDRGRSSVFGSTGLARDMLATLVASASWPTDGHSVCGVRSALKHGYGISNADVL